jgi:hypothetical protein
MKKGLLVSFALLLVFAFVAPGFSAVKDGKKAPQKFVYEENGMRHNLVVMNPDAQGKKAVVDTIEHFIYGDPASDWDTGIAGGYGIAGDTLVNWFRFAAESAEILGMEASFATAGTGTWNAWPADPANTYYPVTTNGQLAFDIPWTITTADENGGTPTGNLQSYDLEGQGLSATVTGDGIYLGYYFGATADPLPYMDAGGHPRIGQPGNDGWEYAKMYLGQLGNWYFWATSTTWTEFIIRMAVRYEQVAPFITGMTPKSDYFYGNDMVSQTVTADITDLDGTIASASLKYQVRGTALVQTETMANVGGDTYSADFTYSFAAGDTVDYWVEATDDAANSRSSMSQAFVVVPAPDANTDVLIVAGGGSDGRETVYETALMNLGKTYYVWNTIDHGGISAYELNYGFGGILWFGFGTGYTPSPFGADDSGLSTFLDNGGTLLLADMDYLYIHGYSNEDLAPGDFGYDYLGLAGGFSDPQLGDTTLLGYADNPISGAFVPGVDSMVTNPSPLGGEWIDVTIAADDAADAFWTRQSASYGYSCGVYKANGNFTTVFLPFPLETADAAHVETVINAIDLYVATGVEDNDLVANSYALNQNYPNPFNPTTQIDFSLETAGQVELVVYNSLGQKVASLVNGNMAAGSHNVTWNGRDSAGNLVASGVYVYELRSGDFRAAHKMLLVK